MNKIFLQPIKAMLLFCLFVLGATINANAQTFDIGSNKYAFNNTVWSIIKDGAGNTYVGGEFTNVGLWNGKGATFNNAGTHNANFAKVEGGLIITVVAIPTGGWYIGGSFTTVNGITRNKLARINADGTLYFTQGKFVH